MQDVAKKRQGDKTDWSDSSKTANAAGTVEGHSCQKSRGIQKHAHVEGGDWKAGKWRPAGENMRNGLRGKEKVKDKAGQEGITKKIRDSMKRVRQ